MDLDSLADLKELNLHNLLCIRDAAQADMNAAIVSFGLPRDVLQAIVDMSANQLVELVERIGNQLLLHPRPDLVDLLVRFTKTARIAPSPYSAGVPVAFQRLSPHARQRQTTG